MLRFGVPPLPAGIENTASLLINNGIGGGWISSPLVDNVLSASYVPAIVTTDGIQGNGTVGSPVQLQPSISITAVTASLKGDGSQVTGVISSSFATTAAFAQSINSSSLATTGSNTFVGNQTFSGSLYQSGTFYGDLINLAFGSTQTGTGSYLLNADDQGTIQFDTYQNIGAALQPYVNTGSFSGSFIGTASYALNNPPSLAKYGKVVLVDAVNGNNSLGAVNGYPFATVNAAVDYVSSSGLTDTLISLAPNTYALTSGFTIPNSCAIRGFSTQTTKLVLTGSGAQTTMITMGENTRLEDVNLQLVSTSSTTSLTGIKLTGTTGTTSKLRTTVLTVDNSSVTASADTNVYGIWCSGSAAVSPSDFSFNFTRGVTINTFSNGGGKKRGVYADTNTAVTFRDTNIYVKAPTSALSTGSYVGVETTAASASLQFRTTSISGPSTSGSYSGSDILQTTPSTGFINAGIQLGPGSDLINKTAGGKPFTTYVTPTTLLYGLKGNIPNGTHYYWSGVQTVGDTTQVFYRFQQKSILQGMSITLRTATGGVVGANNVVVTILKSTTGVAGSGVATAMTATLTDGDTAATQYGVSVNFDRGEYLAVQTTTPGTPGTAADMVIELDVF